MTTSLDGMLVLAGAGKMGGAMLTGWLANGLPAANVVVQDPGPPPDVSQLLAREGIAAHETVAHLVSAPPAVILMAVKPQIMDHVFPPLARLAGPDTLILSVAAGRTIASFATHLCGDAAIVRAIPNTPAAIGRGMTVCVANSNVSAEQRKLCDRLLGAIGEVGWVDDEALIDAATAVSGSGPAYVFLLAECLAAAGADVGLPPELAMRLAEATVSGSGELLRRSGEQAATLRENVTSPNGTTYAALQVLMGDDGLAPLLKRAVEAAARRSRELAG